MSSSVTLTPELIRRWGMAAIFEGPNSTPLAPASAVPHHVARCNGLSFSENGRFLASSHDDGVVQLFSGETGTREATFYSKEYGCRLLTHTHHELGVLHAAGTLSETDTLAGQIAYHSLHDNKVIRFFRAHTARVTSISVHPRTDWFLTTSLDGTFRLWDIRQPNCAAVGSLGAASQYQPVGAFDLSGRVFAVATPDRSACIAVCPDSTLCAVN